MANLPTRANRIDRARVAVILQGRRGRILRSVLLLLITPCHNREVPMFVVVWRGFGWIVLFVPVAAILMAMIFPQNPQAAMASGGLVLVALGFGFRQLGITWNRDASHHELYWIPMEDWGWIFMFCGNWFLLLSYYRLFFVPPAEF